MATVITELNITHGGKEGPWVINVTASNASTAQAIRDAVAGNRYGIEDISITALSNNTEWIEILDGEDVMIGPLVLANGVPWTHRFERPLFSTAGNALNLQAQSAFGIHLMVEGTTGTAPNPASNPNPADTATGVSTTANLTWTSDAQAILHGVYIGTVEADVTNASTASGEYKGDQQSTTYDPVLSAATTYYWRIDEDDGATITKGTTWSFTTA